MRGALGCDTALYVGDDETDEDVFALDEPGRLLTVRVGNAPSRAAFYLQRQAGSMTSSDGSRCGERSARKEAASDERRKTRAAATATAG